MPERELDERVEVAAVSLTGRTVTGIAASYRLAQLRHLPAMSEIRPAIDVFEKARTHDRLEQLEAAREGDPYFRLIESEAGPAHGSRGCARR